MKSVHAGLKIKEYYKILVKDFKEFMEKEKNDLGYLFLPEILTM